MQEAKMLHKPKIYLKNVNSLSEEEYALVRKNSFGASDVASLINIGFSNLEDVILTKSRPYLTEEEMEIGKKPNVRKGKDLESLILDKYNKEFNVVCTKPTDMFQIVPGLTVNYDAWRMDPTQIIPIEIKFVSTFGGKYFRRDKYNVLIDLGPSNIVRGDLAQHVKEQAEYYGIPDYYYTQVQSQIMGTKSEYGELCALFEKDWNIQVYRIYRDTHFERKIKEILKIQYPRLLEAKGKPWVEPEATPKIDENFEY